MIRQPPRPTRTDTLFPSATLSRSARTARRAVHRVQPSAYSGGNTGAFRRKRLYLARHNRKAPPGVTGPRSLYGGIARQQVGLLRDLSYVARGLADQIHRMEQQLHLLARAPGLVDRQKLGRASCRERRGQFVET